MATLKGTLYVKSKKSGKLQSLSGKSRRRGEARHDVIKEFSCRLSWADTRNVTTILLQIISNLYRLEHHGDPEIGKYQYEEAEDDIVSELPLADRICEIVEETHTCGTAEGK